MVFMCAIDPWCLCGGGGAAVADVRHGCRVVRVDQEIEQKRSLAERVTSDLCIQGAFYVETGRKGDLNDGEVLLGG